MRRHAGGLVYKKYVLVLVNYVYVAAHGHDVLRVLVLIGQFLLFIATLMGVDGALTRFHELRQKSPPVDTT